MERSPQKSHPAIPQSAANPLVPGWKHAKGGAFERPAPGPLGAGDHRAEKSAQLSIADAVTSSARVRRQKESQDRIDNSPYLATQKQRASAVSGRAEGRHRAPPGITIQPKSIVIQRARVSEIDETTGEETELEPITDPEQMLEALPEALRTRIEALPPAVMRQALALPQDVQMQILTLPDEAIEQLLALPPEKQSLLLRLIYIRQVGGRAAIEAAPGAGAIVPLPAPVEEQLPHLPPDIQEEIRGLFAQAFVGQQQGPAPPSLPAPEGAPAPPLKFSPALLERVQEMLKRTPAVAGQLMALRALPPPERAERIPRLLPAVEPVIEALGIQERDMVPPESPPAPQREERFPEAWPSEPRGRRKKRPRRRPRRKWVSSEESSSEASTEELSEESWEDLSVEARMPEAREPRTALDWAEKAWDKVFSPIVDVLDFLNNVGPGGVAGGMVGLLTEFGAIATTASGTTFSVAAGVLGIIFGSIGLIAGTVAAIDSIFKERRLNALADRLEETGGNPRIVALARYAAEQKRKKKWGGAAVALVGGWAVVAGAIGFSIPVVGAILGIGAALAGIGILGYKWYHKRKKRAARAQELWDQLNNRRDPKHREAEELVREMELDPRVVIGMPEKAGKKLLAKKIEKFNKSARGLMAEHLLDFLNAPPDSQDRADAEELAGTLGLKPDRLRAKDPAKAKKTIMGKLASW